MQFRTDFRTNLCFKCSKIQYRFKSMDTTRFKKKVQSILLHMCNRYYGKFTRSTLNHVEMIATSQRFGLRGCTLLAYEPVKCTERVRLHSSLSINRQIKPVCPSMVLHFVYFIQYTCSLWYCYSFTNQILVDYASTTLHSTMLPC